MSTSSSPETLPPVVTVIIPTHNRRVLLARTLHSVLSQRDVDLHVLVVDDGGGDGTADVVRGLGDDRVTVLRHPVARGVSAARNTGIAASRTPWLAFVDDDDLWAPGKLRAQLDALEADPSADWCCIAAADVDAQCRLLRAHLVPDPETVAARELACNVVPGGGSGVMARRTLVDAVGGFDEALSNLADWDFYMRLALAGRLVAVDQPLMGYYIHPQGMAHNVALSEREFDYLDVKYARQRARLQVTLDTATWLSYLAHLSYNSGRRLKGTRLQWELLARVHRRPSVGNFVRGWSPQRRRERLAEAHVVTLPEGWEASIRSWLPEYTTDWIDADAEAAGGRWDRVAALLASAGRP